MRMLFILLVVSITTSACSDASNDVSELNEPNTKVDNNGWTVPIGLIDGSGRPFPLGKDPMLFPAKNVEFIDDESLVAAVSVDNQVRAYPYQYLIRFESVNDQINELSYSMTYCPLTQSAVVMNRDFQDKNFVLRASGYLLYENVILVDQETDSFWSQMMVQSIKGPYIGELNSTVNFVEMTWKTFREHFPDALVFTNTSIPSPDPNNVANKVDIPKGDLVYGVIGRVEGKNSKVFIFHYDDFEGETVLYNENIAGEKTLVIGNKKEHYIASYINKSNSTFEAVQNQFPVVMKDSDNNFWNVFGVAVSGPRTGEQLTSHTGFFALLWAWESFYDDFTFVD